MPRQAALQALPGWSQYSKYSKRKYSGRSTASTAIAAWTCAECNYENRFTKDKCAECKAPAKGGGGKKAKVRG